MRSDIKISFDSPEFKVDSKNNVVICKLRFTVDMPNSLLTSYSIKYYQNDPAYHKITVTSYSRTKNNDSFDEEVGKKVALAKAENMAYSYVRNMFLKSKKYLLKGLSALEKFEDKYQRVKKHNIEYMKKF